ncbi:hypothetical protein BJY00DRAFT_306860 [Aspergillus carlsbadensis]|nr:hypothetical protein BJY00DRAFT_306860 [Aspergillus carlsbadensis]
MSTQQTNTLTRGQEIEEPTIDWTEECTIDMTSVRDDFRAFFGQTEEEWNALDEDTWTGESTFPTYEEWSAQNEFDPEVGMFPATDEMDAQMTEHVGVPLPLPSRPPVPLYPSVAVPAPATSSTGAGAGSARTDHVGNSVPLSREPGMNGTEDANRWTTPLTPRTMGRSRVDADAPQPTSTTGVHQQDPQTGGAKEGETMLTRVETDGRPMDSENSMREELQEARETVTQLEELYSEAIELLTAERLKCNVYRRQLFEAQVKRLQGVQQHEVSEAVRDLQRVYHEVRDELRSERIRSGVFRSTLKDTKAKRSVLMVRMEEVQKANVVL